MTNPPEASDITKHLVLYCKSHYEVSEDLLHDIWQMIAKWSWGDKSLKVEKQAVLYMVDQMIVECNPPRHWIDDANKALWRGDYDRPYKLTGLVKDSVTFEEYIRSRMGIVRHMTIDQLTWLSAMVADPAYLPLSENTVRRLKEQEQQ